MSEIISDNSHLPSTIVSDIVRSENSKLKELIVKQKDEINQLHLETAIGSYDMIGLEVQLVETQNENAELKAFILKQKVEIQQLTLEKEKLLLN